MPVGRCRMGSTHHHYHDGPSRGKLVALTLLTGLRFVRENRCGGTGGFRMCLARSA